MQIIEALSTIDKLNREIDALNAGKFTEEQQQKANEIAQTVKNKIDWDKIFKDF